MFKKIIKKILPVSLQKKLSFFLIWLGKKIRIAQARGMGISFLSPEYIFIDTFNKDSVLVDVGCGDDADFSMAMIMKYGLQSIAIDPTRKHAESLASLSLRTGGKLTHKPWAVSSEDGEIDFNESGKNVSGSIFSEHKNIKGKDSMQYKVHSVSLGALPASLQLDHVEFIKLDLEGAEYDLINNLNSGELDKFSQIFIEFHHDYLPKYKINDTCECIRRLESSGFRSFSIDGRNFLFFRKNNNHAHGE